MNPSRHTNTFRQGLCAKSFLANENGRFKIRTHSNGTGATTGHGLWNCHFGRDTAAVSRCARGPTSCSMVSTAPNPIRVVTFGETSVARLQYRQVPRALPVRKLDSLRLTRSMLHRRGGGTTRFGRRSLTDLIRTAIVRSPASEVMSPTVPDVRVPVLHRGGARMAALAVSGSFSDWTVR